MANKIILAVVVVLVVILFGKTILKWTVSWHYVKANESLQVTKTWGGSSGSLGQYATGRQNGVYEQLLGPGRQFRSRIWYDTVKYPDLEVPPACFYLVRNNIGNPRTDNRFLVEPGEQGLQKDSFFTTGTCRFNHYGQAPVTLVRNNDGTLKRDPKSGRLIPVDAIDKKGRPIKEYGPIRVPRVGVGFVGVQKVEQAEEGGPFGILKTVLQPGYYPINPAKISITPFEVGYTVWESHVELQTATVTDANGIKKEVQNPKPGTGVFFPLRDGKLMYLDLTVVYGIWPGDSPFAVANYGYDFNDVETKVIIPQVLGLFQEFGGNMNTREFVEGATREAFQENLTTNFRLVCDKKRVHVLDVLVRGIYPAENMIENMQAERLAQERFITAGIEQQRDAVAGQLEQARRMVVTEQSDFDAQTGAIKQKELQLGLKKAQEMRADANMVVADLKRQTADIRSKITRISGKADADVIEAMKTAEASRYEYMVKAYGGADAYKLAASAEALPNGFAISYIPVGPGTMWTDLDKTAGIGIQELASMKILSSAQSASEKGGNSEQSPVQVPVKEQSNR